MESKPLLYHENPSDLLLMIDDKAVLSSDPDSLKLQPCPICTRTFVPNTLKKHVNICEKVAMKKRKIFDSSRQRREGTDLADFLPKGFGLPSSLSTSTTTIVGIGSAIGANKSHQQHPEQKNSTRTIQQASITPISPKQPYDNLSKEQSSYLQIKQKTPSPVIHNTPSTETAIKTSLASTKKEPKFERKRSLLPPSEPCPYCERCFGVKAYDRHVEWCKEKARLLENQKNSMVKNEAKERLEARIKYKAPCLKSKRAANREKYSGCSCDDSNALLDNFTKTSPNQRTRSMSTSLSSSLMSESVILDKYDYDPFLSAKRQLEELCLPTSTEPRSLTPITPTTPKTPNSTSTKLTSNYSSSSQYNTTTPGNVTNPRNASNFHRTSSLRISRKKTPSSSYQSSSRPLFCPQSKEKPNIQRGISDEGPISSCFLKPEEYDEMPVKSACVNDLAISGHHYHHNSHSPKIIKRDINSSMNRRNLRLNLNQKPTKSQSQSAAVINDKLSLSENVVVGINPISKTDSLAIFLKYENESTCNPSMLSSSGIIIDNNNTIISTDAAEQRLTEKDLKDKTNNTLSKNQTLLLSSSTITSSEQSLSSSAAATTLNKLLPTLNQQHQQHQQKNKDNSNIDGSNNANNNKLTDNNSLMTINKIHPIKLEPLPKNIISVNTNNSNNNKSIVTNNFNNIKDIYTHQSQSQQKEQTQKPLTLTSILNSIDSNDDFIDPKLINVCDNLPINLTKFSDSDLTASSSTDSVSTTKNKLTNLQPNTLTSSNNNNNSSNIYQQHSLLLQRQHEQPLPSSKNIRNSNEKRYLLKRRLRLGKNQFLYDMSPDDDDGDYDNDNNEVQNRDNNMMIDMYSEKCDKTISMMIDPDNDDDDDTGNNSCQLKPTTSPYHLRCSLNYHQEGDVQLPPPIFDDFDFDEFLSSFDENDEAQYPILKDYKKFLLMNRTINKQLNQEQQQSQYQQLHFQNNSSNYHDIIKNNNSSNSHRSTKIENENEEQHEQDEKEFCDATDNGMRKNEIFISIETNQNDDTTANSSSILSGSLSHSSQLLQENQHFQYQHEEVRRIYGNNEVIEKLINEKDKDEKSKEVAENNKNSIDLNRVTTKNFVELQNEKSIINYVNDDNVNDDRTVASDITASNLMMMTYELKDSDEINCSIDNENVLMPISENHHQHMNIISNEQTSKINSDSAYGSLSRHSPTELVLQKNSYRNRKQNIGTDVLSNTISGISEKGNSKTKAFTKPKCTSLSPKISWEVGDGSNKRRNCNFSANSSPNCSESSLPSPIQEQKMPQKQQLQKSQLQKSKTAVLVNDISNKSNSHNTNSYSSSNISGIKLQQDDGQQSQQQHESLLSFQEKFGKNNNHESSKMTKFCHECGSKFIITQAKFCVECGVKRVILE